MKSSNPALSKNIFTKAKDLASLNAEPMTIMGTVNKTGILLVLVFASAMVSWYMFMNAVAANQAPPMVFIWVGMIGGLVLAMITIFKKTVAHITAPLYALFEGLFLGSLSAIFELQFPGIVTQAIMGTFCVFFAMLFIYRYRIIKPTENFKLGLAAATSGIFLIYLLTMILGFFGVNIPFIHESGLIGIGFSLFVVVIASLNLVMDFDFIEQGEAEKAPKFMEWYGAFGLLVTLIWLYIEILRLLSKLRSRN
ncbi:MAG: Bax inhibitor-1/YccA family protein [Pseudomonadota bacterium]